MLEPLLRPAPKFYFRITKIELFLLLDLRSALEFCFETTTTDHVKFLILR